MDVVDDLINTGFHLLPTQMEYKLCEKILSEIKKSRNFGSELFLTKNEFEADPTYTGVNPCNGRNLIEKLEPDLEFILRNDQLVETLHRVLGSSYDSLHHKFVCGIPESWVPEWVRNKILGNGVNNLGPYVRPEFRDMTYFYGIDFHQDIIDWKDRDADFVTVYVYLHDVGPSDAPLHILSGSHKLGATQFPHDLSRQDSESDRWIYKSDSGSKIECDCIKLVGPVGTVGLWHPATLHGTQPDVSDNERISLRMLFAKSKHANRTGIDIVNNSISGPTSLKMTRRDLAVDGSALVKGNAINTARENK